MIKIELVKELRELTGSGMMDCKKALIESNGDIDKSIEILREKGLSVAAKKSGRIATEGLIETYIHTGGRLGIILEINCETDFVAKTEEFKVLAKDIAMHIAAAKPNYISINDIPEKVIENESKVLKNQALNEGKPKEVVDKMIKGRLQKYFKGICLLEQVFIKNSEKTISQLIVEKISKLGEKISIRRFIRYELGEGIKK